MRKAVYPGSFDPVTYGHIDIVQRLQKLFDEVVVLVAESAEKSTMFTAAKRKQMLERSLVECGNVKVETYEGLTVDFVRQKKANTIIRGIRAVADFEYEMAMANMNKKLCSDVETLIVFASPESNYISSRMVKEIAKYGGDVSLFVPPTVVEEIKKHFGEH